MDDVINDQVKIIEEELRKLQGDNFGDTARSHIVNIYKAFFYILENSPHLGESVKANINAKIMSMQTILMRIETKAKELESANSDSIYAHDRSLYLYSLIPTQFGIFDLPLLENNKELLIDSNGEPIVAHIPCFYRYYDES